MAQITVCDWPGCGSTLGRYCDEVEIDFTMLDAAGELLKEEPIDKFRKDLCLLHASALERQLRVFFDGNYARVELIRDVTAF